MTTIYITKDGDTVDAICWNHYGQTVSVTERVLTENRHLAKYGAVLPAGVKIVLPTIESKSVNNKKIKLWQ